MVAEKLIDGYKVINLIPDMTEEERKLAEKETVKNILREYNRLQSKTGKLKTQK